MRVIAGLLLVATAYAATCYTQGNTGTLNNLIQSVVIVFNGTVASTYTTEELAVAFSVKFYSSRPLIVNTTSVVGSNVTLTFLQTTTDFEAQTGASLSVNYTDLADVPGTLTVGGVPLVTGQVCASTVDTVGPVLMRVHANTGGLQNVSLFFSEPVRPCAWSFSTANLTLTRVSVGVNMSLTPQGGSLSTVWYFEGTNDIVGGTPRAVIAAGSVCDGHGNVGLASTAISFTRTTTAPAVDTQTGSQKYYDLNNNGQIDAVLFVSSFGFTNSLATNTTVSLFINGGSYTITSFEAEGLSTDNSVLVKFTDVTLTGTVQISSALTSLFGPSLVGTANGPVSAIDLAPPQILSATSNFGLARVQLTVSEPHSSSLACSQFRAFGMDFSGTQLWSNASTIDCILANHLTNLTQFASARVYLALQAYGVTTSHGLPLWESVSLNLDRIAFAYIATEATEEAWNLLIVNFTSAATASSVSLDSLAAHQYAVASETLAGNSAIYRVSRTCVASTPCLTTNVDATYNLSSSLFNLSMVDLSPPVIVGISGIIGGTKLRVQFSETVTLGHTVPFEIHENGLRALSFTQSGGVFVFTLERALRTTDTTGWNALTATDSAGNVASRTPPALFSIRVDAFSDKLRFTTSLPHQAINASMFRTIPFMTLGTATRVSDTITDIEVTVTSTFVAVKHLGGVLLNQGHRSGFELVADEFPASGSLDTDDNGMNAALAGGLIAGTAVVGIGVGYLCRDTSASKKKKRMYQSVEFAD